MLSTNVVPATIECFAPWRSETRSVLRKMMSDATSSPSTCAPIIDLTSQTIMYSLLSTLPHTPLAMSILSLSATAMMPLKPVRNRLAVFHSTAPTQPAATTTYDVFYRTRRYAPLLARSWLCLIWSWTVFVKFYPRASAHRTQGSASSLHLPVIVGGAPTSICTSSRMVGVMRVAPTSITGIFLPCQRSYYEPDQ